MDQSKSLQKLTESADLIGMVEDLLRVAQSDRPSPATLAGMRVTLRNVRESILQSHDVFAGELVARTRGTVDRIVAPVSERETIITDPNGTTLSDPSKLGFRRRDLRASIEKATE